MNEKQKRDVKVARKWRILQKSTEVTNIWSNSKKKNTNIIHEKLHTIPTHTE